MDYGIPGLAIGIIKDDKVIFEKGHGTTSWLKDCLLICPSNDVMVGTKRCKKTCVTTKTEHSL